MRSSVPQYKKTVNYQLGNLDHKPDLKQLAEAIIWEFRISYSQRTQHKFTTKELIIDHKMIVQETIFLWERLREQQKFGHTASEDDFGKKELS